MKNLFHTETRITGLLGHPIKHSYSPFIHNIAFDLLKLNYIYLPFDVPKASLKNSLKGCNALGFVGLNVTIPHKENVLEYMDNVSEEASIIGSVNTIVNDHGKLKGYNTDVNGILETLKPYKDEINGSKISIVGAGGASRAVIYTLIRHYKPSHITIINRTEERAETLKNYFVDKMKFEEFSVKELFPPNIVEDLRESKLIINSTPIGMFPEADDTVTKLNESFNKEQIVFDMVYNPVKTKFLKIAEKEGAIIIDGLKMLVHQAARSFELWTNEKMPVNEIEKSLKLYIAE